MMQLGSDAEVPVLHTVELIDWATGGPKPTALNAGAKSQKPEIPILR